MFTSTEEQQRSLKTSVFSVGALNCVFHRLASVFQRTAPETELFVNRSRFWLQSRDTPHSNLEADAPATDLRYQIVSLEPMRLTNMAAICRYIEERHFIVISASNKQNVIHNRYSSTFLLSPNSHGYVHYIYIYSIHLYNDLTLKYVIREFFEFKMAIIIITELDFCRFQSCVCRHFSK